jgi:hypothetical protein
MPGIKNEHHRNLPELGGEGLPLSDFQSYFETLKHLLNEGFKKESSKILGQINLRYLQPFTSAIRSGKKIRGVLCLMMTQLLGGNPLDAISRAIAIELIHAATLIHDDFVDQDILRRNRPATWTLEGSRRAVLIGDVIVASAIRMMSEISRADGLAISRAIVELSQGALDEPLDPIWLARDIDSKKFGRDLYKKIIHQKTAVLFGTACYVGALAAEANNEIRDVSYRYGLRIGEAYQLADDIKDLKIYLSNRFITPNQMVRVAPALLHFDGMQPGMIIDLLKGEGRLLTQSDVDSFQTVVMLMEKEIEWQVNDAASEVDNNAFSNNGTRPLLQSAPREIINMFNHHN